MSVFLPGDNDGKVLTFPEKQKNNCGSSELRDGECMKEEVL